MKIAVTYQFGQIFQHFGHTEYFKIFEIEKGEIISSSIVNTNGQGHGALSSFLADKGVNIVICGGIGEGAKNALASKGITVYGGVTGGVDSAIKAFLGSSLAYNPDVCCSNHHSECKNHDCGDSKCNG